MAKIKNNPNPNPTPHRNNNNVVFSQFAGRFGELYAAQLQLRKYETDHRHLNYTKTASSEYKFSFFK